MARIFVNGVSAKAGGGESILTNFLALASKATGDDRYFVLTPNPRKYAAYAADRVTIVDVSTWLKRHLMFPIMQVLVIPRLINRLACDRVLNLADIPLPTVVRQCYLFDWSYAIYPESEAWERMGLQERLVRKAKLFFFRLYARYPTVTVAQTQTAKDRLVKQHGMRDVTVIPNAVSLDHLGGGESHDFALARDRVNLLCLSYYYSHKNIEIFLSLAEKIRESELPYAIITTIAETQNPKARRFLDEVRSRGLDGVIVNIGPVGMQYVPSLYAQCDGLILPTLLESFSGTYVEAMFHEKPILTSDRDFARDVCGDDAYYFDPLNPESVLSAIKAMLLDPALRAQKTRDAARRVRRFPGWSDVFKELREAIG